MTALQWIIKEAKILKKKHPSTEWKKLVAQASAIYASKHKGVSPVGKKKAAPKKVAKKKIDKKHIGDYKIEKAHFEEARVPKNPRKKRKKKLTAFKTIRKPNGRFKKIEAISGIEIKSKTHTDYNKPEVNIQIGAIKTGSKYIYYRGHIIERKPLMIADGKKKKKTSVYITYGVVFHTLENAKSYIRHIAK